MQILAAQLFNKRKCVICYRDNNFKFTLYMYNVCTIQLHHVHEHVHVHVLFSILSMVMMVGLTLRVVLATIEKIWPWGRPKCLLPKKGYINPVIQEAFLEVFYNGGFLDLGQQDHVLHSALFLCVALPMVRLKYKQQNVYMLKVRSEILST